MRVLLTKGTIYTKKLLMFCPPMYVELKECFKKCELETSIPKFIQEKVSFVSDCDKKSIYLDLLKKALRSRMNLAFKQYREKYVGRYAEMESS